jgi:hypothetical protein
MKDTVPQKRSVFLSALLFMSFMSVLCITHDMNAQGQEQPCLDPKINGIVPDAASPGEQIRIRGVRFRNEPGEVTFSPGVAGEIVRWRNKVIHVIVPESAESGPVTVSVVCGSVSNETLFRVKK